VSPSTTMSALRLPRDGEPEALVWREDLPVPRPSAGTARAEANLAGGRRHPGKLALISKENAP
jgi:hypothetical protein